MGNFIAANNNLLYFASYKPSAHANLEQSLPLYRFNKDLITST